MEVYEDHQIERFVSFLINGAVSELEDERNAWLAQTLVHDVISRSVAQIADEEETTMISDFVDESIRVAATSLYAEAEEHVADKLVSNCLQDIRREAQDVTNQTLLRQYERCVRKSDGGAKDLNLRRETVRVKYQKRSHGRFQQITISVRAKLGVPGRQTLYKLETETGAVGDLTADNQSNTIKKKLSRAQLAHKQRSEEFLALEGVTEKSQALPEILAMGWGIQVKDSRKSNGIFQRNSFAGLKHTKVGKALETVSNSLRNLTTS